MPRLDLTLLRVNAIVFYVVSVFCYSTNFIILYIVFLSQTHLYIQLYSPYMQPHTLFKKKQYTANNKDEKTNNSVTTFNTFELVT